MTDPEKKVAAAKASVNRAAELALPSTDPARGVEHDAVKHIERIETALKKEREANRDMREAVITYGARMTLLFRLNWALVLIGIVAGGAIVYQVKTVQDHFSASAYRGCKRANAQNAALLDLGKIITAARRQTSTSPRVRLAAKDYFVQVDKLDPSLPTTKALADLAILLAGDRGKPTDARELAAAEDDFIAKARLIDKPRDCAKAFKR